MINRYSFKWVREWCEENGWTDPFLECRMYWAFPPGGVMPLPVPQDALEQIKSKKGLSISERTWTLSAIAFSVSCGVISYIWQSPMPLVSAFAFCAVVVAQFEQD